MLSGGSEIRASACANGSLGADVHLIGSPAAGSEFQSWFGCDSTSGAQCSVTMNASRTVTVTFNKITHDLGACNDDEKVDAGDTTAIVLEIFDGDGTAPPYDGGTFPGTLGCDANDDGAVDAGDIACLVLIIFGRPCEKPAADTRGRR